MRKKGTYFILSLTLLLIAGVAAIRIAEARTQQAINAEVAALLALGIDCRPFSPENDAADDYNRIEKMFAENKPVKDIFGALEVANKKTSVSLGQQPRAHGTFDSSISVSLFLSEQALESIKKGDSKKADLCFSLNEILLAQLEASGSHSLAFDLPLSEFAMDHSKAVSSYYRKKLETSDFRLMVKARLSGLGRRLNGVVEAPSDDLTGLFATSTVFDRAKQQAESFVERSHLFQQGVKLQGLRSLRALAIRQLSMSPRKALAEDAREKLAAQLWADKSWKSRVASERIAFAESRFDLLAVHCRLIDLDIREAKRAGRAVKPTWSKRYCVDPSDGSPLNVIDYGNHYEIRGKRISQTGPL